jgi:hypothetical protein
VTRDGGRMALVIQRLLDDYAKMGAVPPEQHTWAQS